MMNFCPNCGTRIEVEWKTCPYCGDYLQSEEVVPSYQQQSPPTPSYAQETILSTTKVYPPKESNNFGTVALTFGLLGLFLLPFVGSIVAIVVGSIGRKKDSSPGLATGGLVTGIIGLVCWVIGLTLFIFFFMSMFSGMYSPPF